MGVFVFLLKEDIIDTSFSDSQVLRKSFDDMQSKILMAHENRYGVMNDYIKSYFDLDKVIRVLLLRRLRFSAKLTNNSQFI